MRYIKTDIQTDTKSYPLFGYKKTNDGMDIKAFQIGTGTGKNEKGLICQIVKTYLEKVDEILKSEDYICSFDDIRKCFYLEAVID